MEVDGNLYKGYCFLRGMNLDQISLEKISWGILIIVVAVILIFIGVSGLPGLLALPLLVLGGGLWLFISSRAYHGRAWGAVVALVGALWLSRWFYPLSLYILTGILLAAIGLLIIVGSKMK